MSNFSLRLRELLNDEEKNAILVAKALGVNKTTIYSYLSEKKAPSLVVALKLADYFECSLDFLLGRTEADTAKNPKKPPLFKERLTDIFDFFDSNEFQLAKGARLSRSITYAWLTGKSLPCIANLIKIADYYGCSVDFVVGRED